MVHDAPGGPAMHEGTLIVAVENVGLGPALNVRGAVELGEGGAAIGSGRTLHAVEGIRAGGANAVVFSQEEGELRPQTELRARLAYEDAAGVTYWTDFHYNVSTRGYWSRLISAKQEPWSSFVSGQPCLRLECAAAYREKA